MPRSTKIVVKLSGSLFFSDEFSKVTKLFAKLVKQNSKPKFILVCGGGVTARKYIETGEKLGLDKTSLDEIGILVSRLNASVFLAALNYDTKVPESLEEIVEASEEKDCPLVVCGGLHPGQSTNAVAALISEKLRARRFINATDVEGVYSKDPKKYRDAKLLRKITTNDLQKVLRKESLLPGAYDLMDPIALKLIERSKIPTVIVKCDSKVLEETILDKRPHGTVILS